MRIVATITRPTSGRVLLDGADIVARPDAIRKVLGYLPQDFGVYPNLNAREFLDYLGHARGISGPLARRRIDDLLQAVNLHEVGKRPLGSYSGGMRQRLGIAQALLNDPRILVVDEPTVGLDPEERVRFRNLLSELSGEKIVILSTHIVSDVEAVATRIALIDRGTLVADTTAAGLLSAVTGKVWEWPVDERDLPRLRSGHVVSGLVRRNERVHVRVVSDTAPAAAAAPATPTLEDAYLHRIARRPAGTSAS
jgi:ABC-2 type transport system ATP-binding protein